MPPGTFWNLRPNAISCNLTNRFGLLYDGFWLLHLKFCIVIISSYCLSFCLNIYFSQYIFLFDQWQLSCINVFDTEMTQILAPPCTPSGQCLGGGGAPPVNPSLKLLHNQYNGIPTSIHFLIPISPCAQLLNKASSWSVCLFDMTDQWFPLRHNHGTKPFPCWCCAPIHVSPYCLDP